MTRAWIFLVLLGKSRKTYGTSKEHRKKKKIGDRGKGFKSCMRALILIQYSYSKKGVASYNGDGEEKGRPFDPDPVLRNPTCRDAEAEKIQLVESCHFQCHSYQKGLTRTTY